MGRRGSGHERAGGHEHHLRCEERRRAEVRGRGWESAGEGGAGPLPAAALGAQGAGRTTVGPGRCPCSVRFARAAGVRRPVPNGRVRRRCGGSRRSAARPAAARRAAARPARGGTRPRPGPRRSHRARAVPAPRAAPRGCGARCRWPADRATAGRPAPPAVPPGVPGRDGDRPPSARRRAGRSGGPRPGTPPCADRLSRPPGCLPGPGGRRSLRAARRAATAPRPPADAGPRP